MISKSVLQEDRLRILIVYAKESKIAGVEIDPIFLQEIKDKLEVVDVDYIKENIVDIATGLAYFLPEEAVKIVEKAFGANNEGSSLEFLISYIAHVVNSKSHGGEESVLTQDRIASKFGDKFALSIGVGIGKVDQEDILETLRNIENVLDRLYLAKTWIRKNERASNIVDIINYTTEVLLESSSMVKPTTTNLLDIFKPIKYIPLVEVRASLIGRLEQLMQHINSPSDDYYRLSILIIEAVSEYNLDLSNERAVILHDQIMSVAEHSLKIGALSQCWVLIKDLKDGGLFSVEDFILDESSIRLDLTKAIDSCLSECADHYEELLEVFSVIPRIDREYALAIAERLNIRPRRSEAISKCIEVYTEQSFDTWDIEWLIKSMTKLTGDFFNESLQHVIERCVEQRVAVANFKSRFLNMVWLIDRVDTYRLKCELITNAIILLSDEPTIYKQIKPTFPKPIGKLKGHLQSYWAKIDDPIKKISIGYSIASKLSSIDDELANEYFEKTDRYANSCTIDNGIHRALFGESVRLLIRCYSHLLRPGVEYSYDKLVSLMDYLPSHIDRVALWSEFAIRLYQRENRALSEEIVRKQILPLISDYEIGDLNRKLILRLAAPAVFFTQPENFKLLIRDIPVRERESIVSAVCYMMLCGSHESDPYENKRGFQNIQYQQASDYINLLDLLDTDSLIFFHIKNISEVAKNSATSFSREQKNDIQRRLKKTVLEKLPNTASGIYHDGYKIASRACITHFNTNRPNERSAEFDQLVLEAKSIPNLADRAYTLILVASECPIKKRKLEIFADAFSVSDSISSTRERINLNEHALKELASESIEAFKQRVQVNQTDILSLDDDEKFKHYKKLIDLTFKYDKQLAGRLVAALDFDPGRKQLNSQIGDHYNQLEAEREVQDDYSRIGRIRNRRQMSNLVHRLLGELHSGVRKAKPLEETISMIYTASRLPYFHSLPLFQFFVENLSHPSAAKDGFLISISDHAHSNAKLCYNLINSISHKGQFHGVDRSSHSTSQIVLRPGMRIEAMEFIERFIREHEGSPIYIVDPYFSAKDLAFFADISNWSNRSPLSVLTSSSSSGEFSKNAYHEGWRQVSAESMPTSLFVRASTRQNGSPFHDRWILVPDKQVGLSLGSSLNSIGMHTVSTISKIFDTEVEDVMEDVVNPLLKIRQRYFGQQIAIEYDMFEFFNE